MEYELLYGEESFGTDSDYGIKIEVAHTKGLPDLKCKEIYKVGRQATKLIKDAILYEIKKNDPLIPTEIENNKLLLDLFKDSIYVDEIPNGYCDQWCCKHLPWFIVTTKIGRIKIGWRKRVIVIDWSDTKNKILSYNLFPDEDVTKFGRTIHAWNLEDAQKYINRIIDSVE